MVRDDAQQVNDAHTVEIIDWFSVVNHSESTSHPRTERIERFAKEHPLSFSTSDLIGYHSLHCNVICTLVKKCSVFTSPLRSPPPLADGRKS